MLGKRSVLRLLGLAAVVAALTFAFASSAFAAPTVPIMTFSDLRTALNSGPISGYMRTVVQGSDITTIDLSVLAVPKNGTALDSSSLITFEATGSLIAQYGGIVAGMSGSPVYVRTAQGDKLIGAVSYGDYFTIGGRGLATPIEAMSNIEALHGTEIVPLSRPIITSAGVTNKIIVAPNPQDYSAAAAQGAFVARPLASVFIGGLKPSSNAYKALARDLKAGGATIVNVEAPLSGGGDGTALFSTEMTAGASIAALTARGDMIEGGAGTVTYVNGNNVLAFGHPAFWSGVSAMYMANAWIESIWPSTYEPYKIWDAGVVTGAITQDRGAGILGKTGTFATETTITATARDRETHVETSSTVYVPRQLLDSGFAGGDLVASAEYMAAYKLYDQERTPGSVSTTTTVNLADGKGNQFVVTIPNHTDGSDVPWDATEDAYNAISNLQSVLDWGNEDLKILSVNLEGTYSLKHERATIVGVQAPDGLHTGANHIQVSAVVYGMEATQTIDATLNIPAGTAVAGQITATSLAYASDNFADDSSDAPAARTTISQVVKDLNHQLPNSTVEITFQPSLSGLDLSSVAKPPSTDPITVDAPSQWPMTGDASTPVTLINAQADPSVISYGAWTDILGTVDGPEDPPVVSLYATVAGSSESFVASQTATEEDGEMTFDFPIDSAVTNTTYRVHVDGTASSTGANALVGLNVKAMVSLSTSATKIKRGKTVKLTASIYPNSASGGTVVFEQASGKKWVKIISKTLAASGSYAKATYTWKPGKGTRKVRARYTGGMMNYGNSSSTKTITVK